MLIGKSQATLPLMGTVRNPYTQCKQTDYQKHAGSEEMMPAGVRNVAEWDQSL